MEKQKGTLELIKEAVNKIKFPTRDEPVSDLQKDLVTKIEALNIQLEDVEAKAKIIKDNIVKVQILLSTTYYLPKLDEKELKEKIDEVSAMTAGSVEPIKP